MTSIIFLGLKTEIRLEISFHMLVGGSDTEQLSRIIGIMDLKRWKIYSVSYRREWNNIVYRDPLGDIIQRQITEHGEH
ncbi:MAG: hypothetical protein AB2693_23060 [Candidatus Thiodiazotropha sp.]